MDQDNTFKDISKDNTNQDQSLIVLDSFADKLINILQNEEFIGPFHITDDGVLVPILENELLG